MEKTLDWRCAEQRPHQRLRPAPALVREVGQADRHVDCDDGIVRQAVDQARRSSAKMRDVPARRRAPASPRSILPCSRRRPRSCGRRHPMRSSAAVPAGMHEMAQLHHRHRMRQALRRRSRAAVRRRRAWRCAPGSRTPRRSSTAAPWRRAGRRAAGPGRRRRSGRRARWAACSMMRCSASSASDGVSSRLPVPPAIIAGAEVTSMVARAGIERGRDHRAHDRRAWRRSSIRARSGWASRCRRSASARRGAPSAVSTGT